MTVMREDPHLTFPLQLHCNWRKLSLQPLGAVCPVSALQRLNSQSSRRVPSVEPYEGPYRRVGVHCPSTL